MRNFINVLNISSPISSYISNNLSKLISAIIQSIVVRLIFIRNKVIVVDSDVLTQILWLLIHWKRLNFITRSLRFWMLFDIAGWFSCSWKWLNFSIRWPLTIATRDFLYILCIYWSCYHILILKVSWWIVSLVFWLLKLILSSRKLALRS